MSPAGADVVIQTSHQSQCHRLVLFQQDKSLQAFPDNLGGEAVELGPRSNKAGPLLVLLTGVSVTWTEFIAWYASSHIRRYCPRIFWLGSRCHAATSKEQLLQSICDAGAPPGQVRIQCSPRTLEDWLGSRLPQAFDLDPKSFQYVLNVVDVEGLLRWHAHEVPSTYRQNVLLPQISQQLVSSAVHKLQEALEVVAYQLSRTDIAIDLGAAPGSWSYYLASHVSCVVAVDPANLSPHLVLSNVHHVKCKSEVAGPQVAGLLHGRRADLLVADMNQHPDTTVEAMQPLLQWLRPGGLVIMTMKFYGIGRDRGSVATRITKSFGEEIKAESVKILWLMANTVNERTFIAVRK